MSDVTDADWEKARHLLDTAPLLDLAVTYVARALAEEREKARAPFLALDIEWKALRVAAQMAGTRGADVAYRHCIEDLARAAEETE